jgi:hypothetical protein
MWPVMIFLVLVVAFYWGAFYLTVAAWLNAVGHLIRGNFIRASIWFSIGCGMLFWWQGSDVIPDPWDFDRWLKDSAWIVGLGAFATFVRWCKRHRAMQIPTMPTIPTLPTWPTSSGNVVPFIKVKVERKRG